MTVSYAQCLRRATLIAVAIVTADQASKIWIRTSLRVGDVIHVIPGFFSIVHRRNPGGAFSLFHDVPFAPVLFALISTVALLGIVWFALRYGRDLPLRVFIALAAIAGGAAGNLIDRLIPPHHVIDFLDFYVGSYHWPAFNVADSAICIGAGLMILSSFTHPDAFEFHKKS